MFVPIERANRRRHYPFITFGLIWVNTIIFLLTLFGSQSQLFLWYGFIGASPSTVTLLTSMFLHAGFLHLIGNMLFLYMFGDNVEDVVGSVNFLLGYLISGAAAALL